VADFYNVFARTGGPGRPASPACCRRRHARCIRSPRAHDGPALLVVAQIVSTNARLPADRLIGPEGIGFKIAMSALEAPLGIAACAVGLAQAAPGLRGRLREAARAVRRRITEFQGVGFMLADMATQIARPGPSTSRARGCATPAGLQRRGGQGQALSRRRRECG